MVAAANLALHDGRRRAGGEGRRGQHVVDAPADVALARAGAVGPPTVVAGALLEMAKRVHEARVEKLAEAPPRKALPVMLSKRQVER